jgi:hypothetical protein
VQASISRDGHPAPEVSLEIPLVEVGSGWEFQISIPYNFPALPTSITESTDRGQSLLSTLMMMSTLNDP